MEEKLKKHTTSSSQSEGIQSGSINSFWIPSCYEVLLYFKAQKLISCERSIQTTANKKIYTYTIEPTGLGDGYNTHTIVLTGADPDVKVSSIMNYGFRTYNGVLNNKIKLEDIVPAGSFKKQIETTAQYKIIGLLLQFQIGITLRGNFISQDLFDCILKRFLEFLKSKPADTSEDTRLFLQCAADILEGVYDEAVDAFTSMRDSAKDANDTSDPLDQLLTKYTGSKQYKVMNGPVIDTLEIADIMIEMAVRLNNGEPFTVQKDVIDIAEDNRAGFIQTILHNKCLGLQELQYLSGIVSKKLDKDLGKLKYLLTCNFKLLVYMTSIEAVQNGFLSKEIYVDLQNPDLHCGKYNRFVSFISNNLQNSIIMYRLETMQEKLELFTSPDILVTLNKYNIYGYQFQLGNNILDHKIFNLFRTNDATDTIRKAVTNYLTMLLEDGVELSAPAQFFLCGKYDEFLQRKKKMLGD